MLQWTKTVLYYEFGWKFSSCFSFRFMVTYYGFTDDVCYTLSFPWVTYYQGNEGPLDFISAKFSLVTPKGICFFTFHMKEELLWNSQLLYLHVCHMSVSRSLLQSCLGWDSFSEGGRASLGVDPSIDFASKPKWGNVKQIFGKCKVKFNFRHFSFNEAL